MYAKKGGFMKKQITWSLLLLETAVVVFITSGCPSMLWDITSPPYSISKPVYYSGGVFFNFYNKSNKTVVFVETKMNVLDAKTGSIAFAGTGCITTGAPCNIQNCAQNDFCISLNQYISNSIPSELIVENFFISKIEYSDGSCWKDYLGVYADTFCMEA
jgi:hypothetical protein